MQVRIPGHGVRPVPFPEAGSQQGGETSFQDRPESSRQAEERAGPALRRSSRRRASTSDRPDAQRRRSLDHARRSVDHIHDPVHSRANDQAGPSEAILPADVTWDSFLNVDDIMGRAYPQGYGNRGVVISDRQVQQDHPANNDDEATDSDE